MPSNGSLQAFFPCAVFAPLLAGCGITGPASEDRFDSVNPRDRMSAAVVAAEQGDAESVPELIDMLDASDPGSRFVAARALVQITGQDLGYDPFSPVSERSEAAQRWADWYAASNTQASAEDASE